jgi:gamma-glutamyltranspeptidase/glutathione hydrolase
MPLYGPATVTVPGLVAGWHALWSLGAARPWAEAFAAAVAQAEDGVTVPPSLAAAFAEELPRLAADPGLSALFLRADGTAPRAGDHLRQPALAATLRRLAADGPDAFYRGPVGASLVACLQAHGSPMTEEDLDAFSPEHAEPLRERIGDDEILTAPPNSQGFLLPRILRAAGDRDPLGPDAGDLAAVFDDAAAARARALGDPRGAPRATGDTVAVVAVDSDGCAVSLIQSLFHAFGAGIADPATGIVLHNRGAYFSLDPASPNLLAGGKRPAHTLMPAAVMREGRLTTVLGTMGGSAQPQILAQVLLRLARGAPPQAALDAPRWILSDALYVEAGVPAPARAALARTGRPLHLLPDRDSEVGHTQLVAVAPDGSLSAASDPRSEGGALVVTR